jgi:hypothetical protein
MFLAVRNTDQVTKQGVIMRKKLLRLGAVAFSAALLSAPAVADEGCPDFLVWEDGRHCTYQSGTSCKACEYNCSWDNQNHWYNVCEPTEG